MTTESLVDILVAALSDGTRAEAPASFPLDAATAANPGRHLDEKRFASTRRERAVRAEVLTTLFASATD
jgi:hypothetical protein